MRRVYLDVNVVFDYLLKRSPYHIEAEQIVELAMQNRIQAYVDTQTLIFAYPFLRKQGNAQRAREAIVLLADIITAVSLTGEIFRAVLNNKRLKDLEDAGQLEIALHNDVEVLITRDNEFISDQLLIQTPGEFLEAF